MSPHAYIVAYFSGQGKNRQVNYSNHEYIHDVPCAAVSVSAKGAAEGGGWGEEFRRARSGKAYACSLKKSRTPKAKFSFP